MSDFKAKIHQIQSRLGVTLCFSVTYFTITCQHNNSSEKQPEVLRSPKVSVSKLNTIMQSTTVYIMLQA